MDKDTIVAVATPEGEGGLAVVRLSGPEAVAMAGKVFEGDRFGPNMESHRAVYGILFSLNDSKKTSYPIDQVLALPLLAPHSYTGEELGVVTKTSSTNVWVGKVKYPRSEVAVVKRSKRLVL